MERDDEALRRIEEELLEVAEDRADVEAAREAVADAGPNIPWEQLKAELKL